jgi:hypothetical protein
MTVPTCVECEKRLQLVEDYLFYRLGRRLDPDDPALTGLAQRAMDSIDYKRAKTDRDYRARVSLLAELWRDKVPEESHLPTLPGFEPEEDSENKVAFRISAGPTYAFGERLIRGLTYYDFREYITEDKYDLHVLRHLQDPREILALLERWGETKDHLPGTLTIRRAHAEYDYACGVFEFTVWNRLVLRGIVALKEGP